MGERQAVIVDDAHHDGAGVRRPARLGLLAVGLEAFLARRGAASENCSPSADPLQGALLARADDLLRAGRGTSARLTYAVQYFWPAPVPRPGRRYSRRDAH